MAIRLLKRVQQRDNVSAQEDCCSPRVPRLNPFLQLRQTLCVRHAYSVLSQATQFGQALAAWKGHTTETLWHPPVKKNASGRLFRVYFVRKWSLTIGSH
jgi:hypothetical protein